MVLKLIDRFLRNSHQEERLAALDREISKQKATLRQDNQVLQSGMRVVQRNMAGAMRMVMEAERGKDGR